MAGISYSNWSRDELADELKKTKGSIGAYKTQTMRLKALADNYEGMNNALAKKLSDCIDSRDWWKKSAESLSDQVNKQIKENRHHQKTIELIRVQNKRLSATMTNMANEESKSTLLAKRVFLPIIIGLIIIIVAQWYFLWIR